MNEWTEPAREVSLAHPDNERPQDVAGRFGKSLEWANEHYGPHRCVDSKMYLFSCLVADPSCDKTARSYMRDVPVTAPKASRRDLALFRAGQFK